VRAAAAVLAAIALAAVGALPAGSAPAFTVVNDASKPAATELTGVACVSTTRCFAVGYRENANGNDQGAIEQAYGKTWSKMSLPVPAGAVGTTLPPLASVVCAAPGNCFAVGTYYNALNEATALIHHWNGKAWGLMKAAAPVISRTPHATTAPQTSLTSIACPTPTSCYAVGYFEGTNGSINTLVEHWNGKVWQAQASPTSNALTTTLQGIACVTDTSCFAVGTSMAATHTKPFIVRWNGTAWTAMTSPGLQFAGLDDIACASAKACFALGSVASKTTSTLVERWNGTKWAVVTLKNMPTANHLFGIACPTATRCIAVGRRAWTTAGFRTLAYSWNGGTWSQVAPPNHDGATSNWLNAITCPSPTVCRAVGTYQAGGTYHSLIEYFS
jgi:hypothetical protein